MATGKYRNIKIRVNSVEESVAVQKLLFADGVFWTDGSTNVIALSGFSVLFVSPDGSMTHSASFDSVRPQNYGCVEVVVDFEQILVASIKERPKTVLFGKTYYTDELNARLEGLKTC